MKEKKLSEYAKEIGLIVEEKDRAYGNAFDKAADFLKILYPNGITIEQYGDMLCLVRIFDKQMRIATNKNAFQEDPYRDMAGYSLLGWRRCEKENADKEISVMDKLQAMEEKDL
jgi:hypothetical protein